MHAHSQSAILEFVSDSPPNHVHLASTHLSTTADPITLPSTIAGRDQTGQVEDGDVRVYQTTLNEAKMR